MYNNGNTMVPQQNPNELKFILPDALMSESEFSADELAEDMDGLSLSFPRVKIPSGSLQFEIPTDDPDRPEYSATLEGVILHNHAHCAYWPEGNDSEDNKPICSAPEGKVGIGEPGGTCAVCALNSYGSARKGSGKACKNMRVLYLLRSGEYLPLQINLPPTSIRPFNDFYKSAFALRKRPAYASIVQLGLKRDSNGKEDYSVVTFRRVADFTGEQLQQVKAYAISFKEQIKLILEQRAQASADQHEDICEYGAEEALPMENDGSFTITPTIDGERETLPD